MVPGFSECIVLTREVFFFVSGFSDADIGADGAQALARSLPTSLRELSLPFNPLRVQGMSVLAAGLPSQLRSLEVSREFASKVYCCTSFLFAMSDGCRVCVCDTRDAT